MPLLGSSLHSRASRSSGTAPLLCVLAFAFQACGGKTLDPADGNAGSGNAGSGATGGTGASGGTSGKGGTSGSGGDAGSTSGSGGSGLGGTGAGGTGAGGTGADGGGGTTGGSGGSVGGTGGSVGGTGGSVGGTGGSVGGTGGSIVGGSGGIAGTGGSVGGTGGCGPCPLVACAPPVRITVTGAGNLTSLTATLTHVGADTAPAALQCYVSGSSPCSWECYYYQGGLPAGDYSIDLEAPGYAKKSVDFTVSGTQNCGCCGCLCQQAYTGTATLDPTTDVAPSCCADLQTDPANCGACGHACSTGSACTGGACPGECLAEGSTCTADGSACCDGLTCCGNRPDGPRQCYSACPP